VRGSALNTESSRESGVSQFWRKNTSTLEAAELANLLRALRKVAGHLGPNVGLIEFAGMSNSADAAILIDPGGIMGHYPVAPEKVDGLVGLIVHEALHKIEWSDYVWKQLQPDFTTLTAVSRVAFQKVIHIGEDIYVDSIADRSVFGLYTAKARKRAIKAAQEKLYTKTLSIDGLVYRWWASEWGEDPGGELNDSYRGPLSILRKLSLNLREMYAEKSVLNRCRKRVALYRYAWRELEIPVASWKIIDKRLHWHGCDIALPRKKRESRSKAKEARQELTPELIREIETHLAATSSDITPLIASVAGCDSDEVAPTSRWDFNIPARPVIDRHLSGRIKTIFQEYAERKFLVSRGLVSGRLDSRRLYRAAVTDRCFKQVDAIPSLDWNVTFLMDASGSMRGTKWRVVEHTVANIHRALVGYHNLLQAYAYFEVDGICMISRLIKGRQLLSVPPSGQTASGQAIIAAALFMSRERKRKLLIHVTDGESNYGCPVRYGIDYCKRENIHLVTLGCGCRDRSEMMEQYGRTIQFIDHFNQLPQAIERLLKWSFLYGMRIHKH